MPPCIVVVAAAAAAAAVVVVAPVDVLAALGDAVETPEGM